QAKTALAQEGVGCEPASAAAVAGVRKLCQAGKIEPGAEVVAVLTGNQLKDPDYVLRRRSEAGADRRQLRVEPTREALRAALGGVLAAEAKVK
ncbi:MAG: hypothetical protein V3S55_07385, partial [Nitrospiraceae bacterium]